MTSEARIVLGSVVLAGVILLAMHAWPGFDTLERPEILFAAGISVLGTGVAAVSAFALWQLQHRADMAKADRARQDRQRRILVALRAELFENVTAHNAQFNPRAVNSLRAALREQIEKAESSQHSMPMAVVKRENDVFDNVKRELADMPELVISPVIRYYQHDEFVAEALIAFSEGKFEKLSKDRRKASVDNFLSLGEAARDAGLVAFRAVDRVIGPPKDEMTAEIEKIELALTEAGSQTSNDDNGRTV